MRRIFTSIPTALLTFVLGVGTVVALVRTPAGVQPPAPPETNGQKTLEMVFVIDTTGKVRYVVKHGKGELPEPDKILAEVKKLS